MSLPVGVERASEFFVFIQSVSGHWNKSTFFKIRLQICSLLRGDCMQIGLNNELWIISKSGGLVVSGHLEQDSNETGMQRRNSSN